MLDYCIYFIIIIISFTSAKAAKEAGYKRIFSPGEGSKGIDPWAELVVSVANNNNN